MPKNVPIKRAPYTVSISIALRDRLKTLSKSLGVKTSTLIDEAVMDLLAKHAKKGGIALMSEGSRKTQHVICVASGKGGVGKTTTSMALAYLFSIKGKKKVLLIDADAQVNLTSLAKATIDGRRDVSGAVITRTLEDKPPIDTFILPSQYKNIDIIPGNPFIEKDDFLSKIRKAKLEMDINPWIEMMRDIKAMEAYDVIIMDTHPSSGMATSYPLQACDWVLIPMESDPSSLSGFTEVYKNILQTRRIMNPQIKLLGYFFDRVKSNTSSSRQYIPSAHQTIPKIMAKLTGSKNETELAEGKAFKTIIRDSEDVKKSVILSSAVTERFRASKVSKDFEKLYSEITEALAEHE